MNGTDSDNKELIRRARQGDQEALGELLERQRVRLRTVTRRHLEGKLAARLDESDLIQQTCLSVYKNFANFQGTEEAEFLAWLGKVHQRNIQNAIRDHVLARKRAVDLEESLGIHTARESAVRDERAKTASGHLIEDEQAVELANALETLPPDQRQAVQLRHLEGWPLARIAQHMQRSEAATVGLIKRGMQKLRQTLKRE